MPNRVILGKKSQSDAIFGLWISKPGKDVLSITADSDHLFRTDFRGAQLVMTGKINMPGNFVQTTVTIPALGFKPFVCFTSSGNDAVIMRYLSNTQLRFEKAVSNGAWTAPAAGNASYGNAADRYILYQVWGMTA